MTKILSSDAAVNAFPDLIDGRRDDADEKSRWILE